MCRVDRLSGSSFGPAAHIIAQVARWQGRNVFAFTKPGDLEGQRFAGKLGAAWTGDSTATPPEEMDVAILFAPVGALIPEALGHSAKGGTIACAGIHMSDTPGILWGERIVRSIANLTRRDGEECFKIVPKVRVRTEVEMLRLEEANEAIACLRNGQVRGAAVLVME
jgi:propanol-preferring alcohol dehydrogenase